MAKGLEFCEVKIKQKLLLFCPAFWNLVCFTPGFTIITLIYTVANKALLMKWFQKMKRA